MKKVKFRFARVANKCWREISFKDKGLILIMAIFIMQCIHNLYTVEPVNPEYMSINVIIRTSVAAIFGYFLSSNFLVRAVSEEDNILFRLSRISKTLKDNTLSDEKKFKILSSTIENNLNENSIEENSNDIPSIEEMTEEEKEQEKIREDKKIKEKYFCNRTLQNGIALGIAIIVSAALIIGVNFDLINEGSIATISQFRDLISGSIGFLIGNSSNNKSVTK